MLWAALYLASALAFVYRLNFLRFSLTLGFACLTVLFANILRACSLFYLEQFKDENKLLSSDLLAQNWLHESIGVMAFLCAAAIIIVCIRHTFAPSVRHA